MLDSRRGAQSVSRAQTPQTTMTVPTQRKKKDELTEEERILKEARHNQKVVTAERVRLLHHRKRNRAARIIQKAWKMYQFKTQGILKNARDAIKLKRLDAGELEWKKQIAACTIQLAWRKYARRRLLKTLNKSNNAVLHMWDPNVLGTRQKQLVEAIYTEQLYVPDWHPRLSTPFRPYWTRYLPSSAALSFNFALEQYTQPQALYWEQNGKEYNSLDELDMSIERDLAKLRNNESRTSGPVASRTSALTPPNYSYNMASN